MSEINLNEEVEEVVDDATVMTVPIDDTLSISGEAADAKAVGDALALKADLSAVNTIKVNDASADNQGQILLYGTDIPMSDEDETTLKEAIEAEQDKTGEDITLTDAEESITITSAITALQGKTGADIPISSALGAPSVSSAIAAAGTVKSVNSTSPDSNGNVTLNKVPIADNLDSSIRQTSSGDYIVRTSGGASSLSDGPASLLRVSGNTVRTGYTPESLDFVVNSDSCDASITNMATFRTAMENSGTLTLSYTTDWSANPATYGITVVGTPEDGDSIVAVWVKEVRGTITNAEPTGFSVTGWNLYNQTAGYARVVKYSEDYGYAISGAYTSLAFSATESGEQTTITPGTGGLFVVPSDGYVWVTGGDSTTAIWATWSDWTTGYQGDFQAYSKTTISLSAVMTACFENGLCGIDGVRDYIDIAGGYAYQWIDVLEYSAENLAVAEGSGRPYLYDEDYIYLAKASATVTALTSTLAISGSYTVNGHGLEMFEGTTIEVGGMTSYGMDLKNRLERDVATLSQQTLSNSQKKQVRTNIGAASQSDMSVIQTNLSGLFKYVNYTKSGVSLANNSGVRYTANDMGFSTPSGYKVCALVRYTSGSYKVATSYVNPFATGTTNAIGLWNSSGATQSSLTVAIGILYVKNGFGIT